jgi:DNA-binding winged helix-turn-helix (wHTH) protein
LSPEDRSRYRFAEFTLSPARRSLRRGGREVPLIPRYLDLLILLVERRAVALHRQEIFDRVWADVVVSDGALTQAIRTLRRTLGEDAERTFIRTVSRHGYQFVCPVAEEKDDDAVPAGDDTPLEPAPGAVTDPITAALGRLLDPAFEESARVEAAEELHALGTAEALRRLDRAPGHARAWAYLRDSRWDVAGAGSVPLFAPPAGPAAWAALASLRLRRAVRLAGSRWASASVAGAAAGALAGLLGGLAIAALGGSAAPSLLGALALVGAVVAGLGAAGVGVGLAAAEALVRSRRTLALVGLGAAGGAIVGAAAHWAVAGLLAALFGLDDLAIGGGLEGLVIGAAAGLGFGLTTRRMTGGLAAPRGRARAGTVAATAFACAAAATGLSAAGGRLGAVSLDASVGRFAASRVELGRLSRPFGEDRLGPRTRAALGFGEGLLFGAFLAAGLTRRPRLRATADLSQR